MALSQRDVNKITDNINTGFDKLGRNGGQIPKFNNNTDPLAWDMYVSKHLATRAKKRRDEVNALLVQNGIIPDPKIQPQGLGERVLYSSDDLMIELKVTERNMGVDLKQLYSLLILNKVDKNVLDKCWLAAMKEPIKPHEFSCVPIIET